MSKIVIMPGGFHPFHAGHAALYQSAVKAFPDAEVYVAATNDTSTRPFPFSIKEKLAKLAGVAPGHFVQVKSPFKAEEITSQYNPNEDVLIFVRSEKDRNESPKPGGTTKNGTPSYFQPYTGKNLQPFSKHAYFAYLPTVEFGPGITSATEIRNAWPKLNDKRKTAMVMSLYPTTQSNPKLAANVVKMLDMGMGEQAMAEDIMNENASRLLSAEDRNGVITVVVQAPDGTKKSLANDNIRYINQWLMKYNLELPRNITSKFIEDTSPAIADTAKSLSNPPKVMQHRAKRDQEREQQWLGTQMVKRDKTSKDEWGNFRNLAEHKEISQPLFWSDLDEGMSIEDKMTIFEEFYAMGSLTESTSEDNTQYFNSLLDLATVPIKNKKYIVVPITLSNNKIILLDVPSYMIFLGRVHDGMKFKSSTSEKVYPSPGIRKLSMFQIFTFDSQTQYNKFKTALSIKFDTILPDVEQNKMNESKNISVEQLAHISDKALDDAYHYGRSTPGANFGWLANIQSAKAAKRLIDSGETDIEKISDAIHQGWNVTAAADYKGQLQLDTPTPDEKKLKRAKLAMQSYSQLPEDEKEKDRVVARALLTAIVGEVNESFGLPYPTTYEEEYGKVTNESVDYLDEK